MKKMFKYLVCLIVISALVVFGIDLYVVFSTKGKIVNEYSELKDIDCIVVLGAGVYDDKPSPMLKNYSLLPVQKSPPRFLIIQNSH